MTDIALDPVAHWIDAYTSAADMIGQLEERKAHARAQLEAALGDNETGTVDGQPRVRWTHVTARRLDQKKALALLGSDADAAMVETTSRRFVIVKDES